MRFHVLRRLILLVVAVAGLLAAGCTGPRCYLEPKYRGATYAQIKPPPAPIPVVLTVRGETNGETSEDATAYWDHSVKRVLAASKVFTPVDPGTAGAAHLALTINNLGDTRAAFGKGVATSLTLGTVGGTVTDSYVMAAEFATAQGRTFQHDYRHAIYTTRGHTHPPVDDTPVSLTQAPALVTDDMVLGLLKDLAAADFY